VSRRERILSFGGCGVLVIAGVVCAVVVPGGTGQVLVLVLVSLGLMGATALVFLEVGLSEDRERAREAAAQRRAEARASRQDGPRRSRLERGRGHPRRLP
jgi:hypothetical protein